MEIPKRGKSCCAYKTLLQGGLLASCMFFAPLANSAMALINPTPPESLRSVDIPEGGAWLNARFDIRDNQPITFGVQDPWDFIHQLNLVVTYDKFSIPGIPLTLDNDVLTGLDVTIVGAAANIMGLRTATKFSGFDLFNDKTGLGVPTSSSNGNGIFVDGAASDNSDDRRTFSLALAGDPLYRGDNWSILFNGAWENPPDTASAVGYDVMITPYVSSSMATPIPGAVWLLGSGMVGLLGWGRMRNRT